MPDDLAKTLLPGAIMVLAIMIVGVFINPDDETVPVEEPVEPNIVWHTDLPKFSYESPDFSCAYEAKAKHDFVMSQWGSFVSALDSVTIPTTSMELTSLGSYWVTNYCPAECGGSWATSSGATCHRASYENRLTEPTTCAIDLSVNDYGDLFYIPAFDRVFIAEDTGSGVKGKWLDLFYVDYADVVSFPVGYYEVYSVEYVYGEVPANTYSILKYVNKKFDDALVEYNYECPDFGVIINQKFSPFDKIIIVDIYPRDLEKCPPFL